MTGLGFHLSPYFGLFRLLLRASSAIVLAAAFRAMYRDSSSDWSLFVPRCISMSRSVISSSSSSSALASSVRFCSSPWMSLWLDAVIKDGSSWYLRRPGGSSAKIAASSIRLVCSRIFCAGIQFIKLSEYWRSLSSSSNTSFRSAPSM